MDDMSVCSPLTAESDALNNTTSTPYAASITDADKVINTKIDSSQVEGDKSEEELLKGLLTDGYCHVCEAVLLFESQRLSHYEGKKHAQKLRVYLQAKRAEKMSQESARPQRIMSTDKDRFCELCNMVFSSHVVAISHYEGKVHAKNLRKQGRYPPDRTTEILPLPILTQDFSQESEQKSSTECSTEHHLHPAATRANPEVDLKDPSKYCGLCAASFNNPQMAMQHYNGRKHQRNQARQEMLNELGDDVQQANSLLCQMCSVQFNSVEMYQAHMQGNKHQTREKKVIDLCKSQQKVYSTFADELADYIQVQKARGLTPKTSQVLCDTQNQDGDEDKEDQEDLNKGDVTHQNNPTPAETWRPSYQGQSWPTHGWNCPPPFPPCSGPSQFTGLTIKRKRHRKQSSSTSCTSSSYSSYSSSTSDSDDSNNKCREKRRVRKSWRARGRRSRDEESEKEEKKKRRLRRHSNSQERREQSAESNDEGRRKKRKNQSKQRRKEKMSPEDNFEVETEERLMDSLKPEGVMMNRKQAQVYFPAAVNVEVGEAGKDDPAKPKYKKEKKKTREKADTRTDEEKLWDDSILGC
ncbi:zinc finger matrin-type protein 1 [Parambassis ranga]|uniref:Zinc finger matrin-type protein 1 n=1 Tax=Parambassis ranga TaxID=210632 RepID=A0A6P7I041_9TELE|nr:zinc finger matrin-type protein 1-like [Parambassis ranga]